MDNNNKEDNNKKTMRIKRHINYKAYMPWLLINKTLADKYTCCCCFCCAFDCILFLLCITQQQQQAQLQQQPEYYRWEWKDTYKLILFSHYAVVAK